MRSPETAVVHRAPMRPLLGKELREIMSGRALWTMLLILCPLVGYSFFQAVSLYDEASAAAAESPVLGSGLSGSSSQERMRSEALLELGSRVVTS